MGWGVPGRRAAGAIALVTGAAARLAVIATAAVASACLSLPAPPAGDDGDGDGGGDSGPPPAHPADVLFFPFDEIGMVNASFGQRDHSGNGFDGQHGRNTRPPAEGRFGVAIDPRTGDRLRVPDRPPLLPPGDFTVAAWVRLDAGPAACAAIYGDHDGAAAELALELRDGRLTLTTSTTGGQVEIVAEEPVPAGPWVHVAATRAGAKVILYHDGVAVGIGELDRELRQLGPRPFVVGDREAGGCPFPGLIDEVMVAGRALDPAALVAASQFDSSQPWCGDGVIAGDEACEPFDPCCAPDSCLPHADGVACLLGGSCQAGTCVVAATPPTAPVVSYLLDEIGGTTLSDSGALGLDLTIVGEGYELGGGCLITTSPTIALNSTAAPLTSALVSSGAFTLEAWAAPFGVTTSGPARLATLSKGAFDRNVSLLQHRDYYQVRLRSAASNDNGQPAMVSAPGDARPGALQHLVVTRAADGEQRLYVDGRLRHRIVMPGALDGWLPDAILALADENDGATITRVFLGELAEVAIYPVAFDHQAVAARFANPPAACR
jgi:hypothetical protein